MNAEIDVDVNPDRDLDRYGPNGDSMKQCPWCGEQHDPTDRVWTVDGRTGPAVNFIHGDFHGHTGIRLYHERCWRKRELIRKAATNTALSDYE